MKIDKIITAFITELGSFAYNLSSLDHVWNILFPDGQGRWHRLHVNKYKRTYYITHIDGDCGSLEFEFGKSVRVSDLMWRGNRGGQESNRQPVPAWDSMVTAACKWLACVKRDWIKANIRSGKVHISGVIGS